jgi:hypothetical protein
MLQWHFLVFFGFLKNFVVRPRKSHPFRTAAGDVFFKVRFASLVVAQPGLTNPPSPCEFEPAWRRTVQTRMAPH